MALFKKKSNVRIEGTITLGKRSFLILFQKNIIKRRMIMKTKIEHTEEVLIEQLENIDGSEIHSGAKVNMSPLGIYELRKLPKPYKHHIIKAKTEGVWINLNSEKDEDLIDELYDHNYKN